jgi:hypothetical protein
MLIGSRRSQAKGRRSRDLAGGVLLPLRGDKRFFVATATSYPHYVTPKTSR